MFRHGTDNWKAYVSATRRRSEPARPEGTVFLDFFGVVLGFFCRLLGFYWLCAWILLVICLDSFGHLLGLFWSFAWIFFGNLLEFFGNSFGFFR